MPSIRRVTNTQRVRTSTHQRRHTNAQRRPALRPQATYTKGGQGQSYRTLPSTQQAQHQGQEPSHLPGRFRGHAQPSQPSRQGQRSIRGRLRQRDKHRVHRPHKQHQVRGPRQLTRKDVQDQVHYRHPPRPKRSHKPIHHNIPVQQRRNVRPTVHHKLT